MKQGYHLIIGVIIILGVILSVGCTNNYQARQNTPKATPPVNIKINMLQTPKLNDIATLEFEVINKIPNGNPIQVDLLLPEGFKFVEGDFILTSNTITNQDSKEGLRWFGNLSENETIKLSAKVRAVKSGEYWPIDAIVGAPVEGGQFGGEDILYVSFNETSGEVLTNQQLNERGFTYDYDFETGARKIVKPQTNTEEAATRID